LLDRIVHGDGTETVSYRSVDALDAEAFGFVRVGVVQK
jgi:hypothetical protein